MSGNDIVVASHNLMRCLELDALIARHRELQVAQGLDVLLLQEAVVDEGDAHIRQIAAALGSEYRYRALDAYLAPALIYNGARFHCSQSFQLRLPVPEKISWVTRKLLFEDKPIERHAIGALLHPRDAADIDPLAVASFHLDAFRDNKFRIRQLNALYEFLRRHDLHRRLILGGDTNFFRIRRRAQRIMMREVLEAIGLFDSGLRPTHYFKRQEKGPKFAHRVPHYLGKVGLDWPERYDIVASNLHALDSGTISTPESDHDLVWARFDMNEEKNPAHR